MKLFTSLAEAKLWCQLNAHGPVVVLVWHTFYKFDWSEKC